jgi:hypothetical protein
MLRRSFVAGVAMLTGSVLGLRKALAAPKTYKYRCPKCQLIEEYAQPGIRKCPKDGFTMIKVN